MESNSVRAEVPGGLSYTGGSSNNRHDAQKECWYGRLGLYGVGGRVGESWATYFYGVYSGPAANYRVIFREQTHL